MGGTTRNLELVRGENGDQNQPSATKRVRTPIQSDDEEI